MFISNMVFLLTIGLDNLFFHCFIDWHSVYILDKYINFILAIKMHIDM